MWQTGEPAATFNVEHTFQQCQVPVGWSKSWPSRYTKPLAATAARSATNATNGKTASRALSKRRETRRFVERALYWYGVTLLESTVVPFPGRRGWLSERGAARSARAPMRRRRSRRLCRRRSRRSRRHRRCGCQSRRCYACSARTARLLLGFAWIYLVCEPRERAEGTAKRSKRSIRELTEGAKPRSHSLCNA